MVDSQFELWDQPSTVDAPSYVLVKISLSSVFFSVLSPKSLFLFF